ncbi:MAG TPA: nucleoside monophosphate kinase [Candidatus Paceibacterota bacterium]
MNLKTFILVGRSGSGKGTQAKLLIETLRLRDAGTPVAYLEGGEKFRELIARDTFTSLLARKIMEEGGLQPAFLAIHNWSHLFIESITGNEHLIIDGSPRKLNEARILSEALKFYKRDKPIVLHVSVSREWSKERLLERKRADDGAISVEARLNWFESDVAPAIEYFRDQGSMRVIDINGEQSIEDVQREIVSKVWDGEN